MAGQPRRRAMIDQLEVRTRDYFEDDPVPTTLDYIACWIEDGNSILKLADELSDALGFTVYAQWIHTYLRKTYGDALDARLVESRARASHMLAEHALAISDEKAETSVDVARAGLRARTRQWTAERWNPTQYGQSKGVNVAISVTQLHLAALQHVSNTVTGSAQLEVQTSPSPGALPSQATAAQQVSHD